MRAPRSLRARIALAAVAALLHDLAPDRDLHERPASREQALLVGGRAGAPAAPGRLDRDRAGKVARPPRGAQGTGRRRPPRDLLPALAKVAIDRVTAVALDAVDQERAGQRVGERQRRDRGQRDPRAQAAGGPHARSAQPSPRTVWRMRGSPSPSSLRRR